MDTATALVWLAAAVVFIAGGTVGALAMALFYAASKPDRAVPDEPPSRVERLDLVEIHDAVAFDDWLDDA